MASRTKERGSGPVLALLMFGLVAVLFAAGLTGVLSAASTERSGAQHAADAAALAGAQGVIDGVDDALAGGFENVNDITNLIGGGNCLQLGRTEAMQLADANKATVTSYCYNVFRDEVSVSTQLRGSNVEADPPARGRAVAASTFEASECRLDPSFELPSPSPSPTETDDDDDDDDEPTEPPEPPDPINTWVDCGFGRLSLRFDFDDLRFHFVHLTADLADLKPKLTD